MGEAELLMHEPIPIVSIPVTNERIFDLLFKEEDITWQALLYQLVETHQMDPWDIDVSLISKKFIDMIKKLKELDFRVSGKVVLASAILLRMKSTKFISEDITHFDSIIHSTDAGEVGLLDDGDLTFMEYLPVQTKLDNWIPTLFPRTPQPRKRKVSIYDLVNALEKALEVKNRRVFKDDTVPTVRPLVYHKDISLVIKDVYELLLRLVDNQDKIVFEHLLPTDASRNDKVLTFIPLLHLRNQQKVDLLQEIHFGEIEVQLMKENIGKPIVFEEVKPAEETVKAKLNKKSTNNIKNKSKK